MEFIVEFIMELVLDGAIEIAGSSRVARRIRIIVASVLTVFYIAFLGLFVVISIQTDEIIVKGITVLLAILFVYVFVRMWRKVIKGEPMKEDWE